LIHFIHSINRIGARLNIYDYVSDADGERLELARQKTRLEQLGSATENGSAKGTGKAK
jgi:hypothetical protein